MKKNLNKIYDKNIRVISSLLKKRRNLNAKLAKYNYGYKDFDFKKYFQLSKIRYTKTLEILNYPQNQKILDIGGFFGIWALILNDLQNKVSIVEKYDYYDNYFNNIRDYLISKGIKVINKDFVLDKYEGKEKYDIITCLALLEHLSSSPKILFNNINKLLNKNGSLIIEVPNLAYYSKRIKLLSGQTIYPKISDIYNSAVPFTGHNHEYTIGELHDLADIAGFKITKIKTYNYSMEKFGDKIYNIPALIFPNAREVLLVQMERK